MIVFGQLVNGGFEDWDSTELRLVPHGWGIQEADDCDPAFTITQSNDAYSGDYSLKITSGCVYVDVFNSGFLSQNIDMSSNNDRVPNGISFRYNHDIFEQFGDSIGCAWVAIWHLYESGRSRTEDHWYRQSQEEVWDWQLAEIPFENILPEEKLQSIFLLIQAGSCNESIRTYGNSYFYIDDIQLKYNATSAEDEKPDNYLIYPNPVRDKINIEGVTIQEVQLYDVFGKKLDVYPEFLGNQVTMDVKYLPNAIYFLKINDPENRAVAIRKICKRF